MTENLTKKDFLEKVFNYEVHQDWKYEGTEPAIIDFGHLGVVPVKW